MASLGTELCRRGQRKRKKHWQRLNQRSLGRERNLSAGVKDATCAMDGEKKILLNAGVAREETRGFDGQMQQRDDSWMVLEKGE